MALSWQGAAPPSAVPRSRSDASQPLVGILTPLSKPLRAHHNLPRLMTREILLMLLAAPVPVAESKYPDCRFCGLLGGQPCEC